MTWRLGRRPAPQEFLDLFVGPFNVPGDWNIPLADPGAEALKRLAPPVFANPAVGLSEAASHGHFGYADWSYLPPKSEHLVTVQRRALAELHEQPARGL